MLQLSIILLIIGILAIVLELLMPGFDSFISGAVGIMALIASAIVAILFVPGGWMIVGINVGVVGISGYIIYRYIRRKQFHGKIILSENLAEDLPMLDLAGLVGKEGKVITPLRPYGEVDFNGVRVEVSSGGPLVDPGVRVRAVATDSNRVLVNVIDGN